ncbi:FecR domain-containing protein [Sphingobacterium paramultivorum]|uniref:FecR domain-containing protein n=2 Tax=Sphingobacterium TaxID=28453 RepID=A0A7G5DXF7_9SPHI|nr:FecR family protein [Sphingobacterium paramultivorum]QMV66432.1 FecR domain-containing protein [Sphingobacterium paramultivorum]WSO15227.1 FecR domain-containing protein [Sphingobacterium paramultivorum]
MDPKEEEKLIRISALILQKMQGTLTGEDRFFLESWLQESERNKQIYQRCLDEKLQRDAYTRLQDFETRRNFESLKAKISFHTSKKGPGLLKRLLPYVAAASVLLALSVVWYWNKDSNRLVETQREVVNDRLPASHQAVITLSDGRQYALNKGEKQVVIDGGGIRYEDGHEVAPINAAVSARIETPRGGIYEVTLPDGTLVKLNAGTTLSYPTVFAKDKREVTLRGEAYFEVAKKKDQPFIVHTKNQQVQVLGTHFNINAYQTSVPTKTTLLEGKVMVTTLLGSQKVTLLPGDQSVNTGTELTKHPVNVQQEMAWVYGKFNFDGKSLRQVMDELSQWYAIDVVYKGDVPNVSFFGGTFRTSKLSTILKILKDQDLSYHLTENGKLIIEKNDPKAQKGGQ